MAGLYTWVGAKVVYYRPNKLRDKKVVAATVITHDIQSRLP